MFQEKEYYNEHFADMVFSKEELIGVKFYDCTFTKCDFSETVFDECRFSDCTFASCDLSMIKLLDSSISQASFKQCKLVGVDWTEASWSRIVVPGTLRFDECVLNHSTFIGLALPKSVIIGCTARNVDFRETNLQESNMTATNFAESLFSDTNLAGADLSHALNYAIDPSVNRISKAKFTLPEAISLLYSMDIELIED
ncbi:pentapeptide repeat-containing protein [Paenibacillus albus]|uniref:pentapeptide repeat-containing protein n=1 Tax=Paenibacillus albus TaxID=2495582 RepID=UPI0013DEBEFA|nr:pentapeptide repeat-containing protein [Paenibacillus albus]